MRKLILALVLTTAVCLVAAAAAAADPGSIQASDQSATTSQQAGAASSAAQVDPTNTNVSIRVLSPGADGDVTQSNTVGSSAIAGNRAGTTQSADQDGGGSGIQTSEQQAGTDQLALALSAAQQVGASNSNEPVRVLSPGSDGDVSQSNTAGSSATAGNSATTGQTSSQSEPSGSASCGCDSSGTGVQTAKQDAGTLQGAGAASSATQDHPKNTNVSIRVLSPGGNGSVSQANTAGSSAAAGNSATTTQQSGQSQGGSSCGCTADAAPQAGTKDAATSDSPVTAAAPVAPSTTQSNTAGSSASAGNRASTGQSAQQDGSASAIQSSDQSAETGQLAGAFSQAAQDHPSNTNVSIRVLSPGSDGNVTQANTVGSSATAGNSATTHQTSDQDPRSSCGCQSTPTIQVAGQQASTEQGALAASSAEQVGASNVNAPVRVLSPGHGGDVTQSNTVGSSASSGNAATTDQWIDQDAAGSCGCGGTGAIQVAGQKSDTEQASIALSAAIQAFGGRESPCGCGGASSGNVDSPVRVLSYGSDGDVTQSNTVGSSAISGNHASTTQGVDQDASGPAIQVAGQKADTGQLSFAASLAAQLGASNTASPVRVKSPAGGGSLTQANTAGSSALAGNAATTGQTAEQGSGRAECGCSLGPIQVSGQQSGTWQLAKALSLALQERPSNTASPVRVWSPDELKLS